ncbi:hypothetical protein ACNOYE_06135 [Nannocystaceae bacterium ST9]
MTDEDKDGDCPPFGAVDEVGYTTDTTDTTDADTTNTDTTDTDTTDTDTDEGGVVVPDLPFEPPP